MGIRDNIAFIRADEENRSQDLFIHFLKQYPGHMKFFPNYVGKSDLKKVPKFPGHVQKVVSLMLQITERALDKVSLVEDAKTLVGMDQHAGLSASEFQDLYTATASYLVTTLGAGACDKAAWESVGKIVVAALKAAGMKAS